LVANDVDVQVNDCTWHYDQHAMWNVQPSQLIENDQLSNSIFEAVENFQANNISTSKVRNASQDAPGALGIHYISPNRDDPFHDDWAYW
jgi:hypothetical protein